MQVNDLKPKHLVLSQDFDGFSVATSNVDFDIEDLCCQVIAHTSVYYWINTESVWGPIGFQWSTYNKEGYFTTSNLDFNYIPAIPDSYRHQSIDNLFKNFSRDLTFYDSDWSHIENFNLVSPNKYNVITWYIDLKDENHSFNLDTWRNYRIIGNLGNSEIKLIYIILQDSNKNTLNARIAKNNSIKINLKELTYPEFDIRDYFNGPFINSYNGIQLTSSNREIILPLIYNDSSMTIAHIGTYFDLIPKKLIIDFSTDSESVDVVNELKYNAEYINLLGNDRIKSIDYLYKYKNFSSIPDIPKELQDKCTEIPFYQCFFNNINKDSISYALNMDGTVFYNCYLNNNPFPFKVRTINNYTFNEDDTYEQYPINSTGVDFTQWTDLKFDLNNSDTQLLGVINTPFILVNQDYCKRTSLYQAYNAGSKQLVVNTGITEFTPTSSNDSYNYYFTGSNKLIIKPDESGRFYGAYLSTVYVNPELDTLDPEWIQFDSSIDILSNLVSPFNTFRIVNLFYLYRVPYPLIVKGDGKASQYNVITVKEWLIPYYKTINIYRYNIDFTSANDIAEENLRKIIDGVLSVQEDSQNECTITTYSRVYNMLTDYDKDRLITGGYTIIEQI